MMKAITTPTPQRISSSQLVQVGIGRLVAHFQHNRGVARSGYSALKPPICLYPPKRAKQSIFPGWPSPLTGAGENRYETPTAYALMGVGSRWMAFFCSQATDTEPECGLAYGAG